MAKITKNDVTHLAHLSNVSLTTQETESLQAELEAIVGYIDQLSSLDTKGVEPTYQVSGLQNVWREDTVNEQTISRTALLDLAPSVTDNQIKVPKVL